MATGRKSHQETRDGVIAIQGSGPSTIVGVDFPRVGRKANGRQTKCQRGGTGPGFAVCPHPLTELAGGKGCYGRRISLAYDRPEPSLKLVSGQQDPSPAGAAEEAHVRPEPDHLPLESPAGVSLLESDGTPEPQVGRHPQSALPARARGGVGAERLLVTTPGPPRPRHR